MCQYNMKTKNHRQIRGKLIFYIEGQLPFAEMQLVEKHLEACSECGAYFDELKSSLSLLDINNEQEVGPYFVAGVQNRIQASRTRPLIFKKVLQPVLVVFLLALGIRFGIWVGDHSRMDVPATEQAVLMPFDDLAEEPIEEFLLNLK